MNSTQRLDVHSKTAIPPMPFEIKEKEKVCQIAQRSLLVAATVCSILSIIPPLRLAGSLALRSVALLSSSTTAVTRWSEESVLGKLAKVAKVAGVALGLVALAAALPALMVASIGVDLAVQVVEAAKAAHQGKGAQAFMHLGFAIVDTLALAGIVAGSWQLMVAAISVNIAIMAGAIVITAVDIKKGEEVIDVICYAALGITGMVGAITSARIVHVKTNAHFSGKNETNNPITFYDKDDNVVAKVQPGERYDFTLDYNHLSKMQYGGSYLEAVSSTTEKVKMLPTEILSETYDFKPPLDPKLFPTLPVGGTSYNIPNKETLKDL